MVKGQLTWNILNILSKIGEGTVTIISESFFSPKYSFTKPTRYLLGLDRTTKKPKQATVSVILSRLKRDGLVEKIGSTRNARWYLTKRGDRVIQQLSGKFTGNLPREDGKFRIVTFDIPEKERRKRQWLRNELVSCNYHLLQKSVWLGKRPLPLFFLKEAESIGLMKYLHIFEISKRGTIKEV
jgi:DNA-binding transcriptional regulator PaaX